MVLVDEILFIFEHAGGKVKLGKCDSFVEKTERLNHIVPRGTLEVEAASTARLGINGVSPNADKTQKLEISGFV